MSGSSLDGLDMLHVHFPEQDHPGPGSIKFEILSGKTLSYSADWRKKLANSSILNQQELFELHREFGVYLGSLLRAHAPQDIDYLALHGHTVYHEPSQGFTFQLGDPHSLSKESGIKVISDFRTADIQLGGQGAPLAPTVEHWIFNAHRLFLNLGGIANISYHKGPDVIGFDIGAANQLLNALAEDMGMAYDRGGKLAQAGTLIPDLLSQAQQNNFYQAAAPKSLSNQWVQQEVIPIFKRHKGNTADKLATACALITWQTKVALNQLADPKEDLFITGGGAFNSYLMELFEKEIMNKIIIPEDEIVEQKEALLMALMGYLKLQGIENVMSSVTGAVRDVCAGEIYETD